MRQRGPKRAPIISALTSSLARGGTMLHTMTVLRPGPIGDTGVGKNAADMFVDIAPHISLRGLDIERTYDRRGNTMRDGDESHIQARTRGKRIGKKYDGRSHHVGGGGEPLVRKEHKE